MSNPNFIDVDFGEYAKAPASDKLVALTELVTELEAVEAAVTEAENLLAVRKKRLQHIMETEMPELMLELNQPILHTSDGRRIEVKDVVRASLPEGLRPLGHDWLIKNGHAGLVKRTVEVAFAAVEGARAEQLFGNMTEQYGSSVRQVMKVEPAALTAFIRKQVEREAQPDYSGPRLPLDVFQVREFKHARISQPRK